MKDAQNFGTLRKVKYECSWEQVSSSLKFTKLIKYILLA